MHTCNDEPCRMISPDQWMIDMFCQTAVQHGFLVREHRTILVNAILRGIYVDVMRDYYHLLTIGRYDRYMDCTSE